MTFEKKKKQFGFSEKATKFEKKRLVLRTQQCTCQKVGEDFSKQMWSSREGRNEGIIYLKIKKRILVGTGDQ